ncbi:MAG: hypothetical protein E7331_06110 [Clostridiales bacterium]|nr:hypothetical protein [Clostridiales bacterium]
MKKRFFAILLAVMLVLGMSLTASADEYNWEIGICTKITINSTDTPTVYIAGSFVNNDSVALSPSTGTAKLYDASDNLLYEGSVYCIPSVVQPGERAYFSIDVRTSNFTNPDAKVDDYTFDFEPYKTSYISYERVSASVEIGTELDSIYGYPVTLSITNNTGAPMEDFNIASVFIDNSDGEPIFVSDTDYIYNRIPVGSTILFNTYIPEAVLNLINEQIPNHSVEALVYVSK